MELIDVSGLHEGQLLYLSAMLAKDQLLYADTPGHRASDAPTATIHPNILLTPYCSDLVLISGSSISLLQLTYAVLLLKVIRMHDPGSNLNKRLSNYKGIWSQFVTQFSTIP